MIFENNTILEIEEGLILESPKMEIMSVFYNLKTNEFEIEVHFWETKFRHSRTFGSVNPNPGSLNMDAILVFVSSHPLLSKFTLPVEVAKSSVKAIKSKIITPKKQVITEPIKSNLFMRTWNKIFNK